MNYIETIQKGFKHLSRTTVKNSPTILTGLAVGGLIATVILAVRATPKAIRHIEEEEEYNDQYGITNDDGLTLTPLEIIKVTWKDYVPAALMGTATIACIIGSNSINQRRNAAIAGAFALTKEALEEYRAKVVEKIGEKKELAVRESIDQDALDKNPPVEKSIIMTGKGDMLCYDRLSSRYFKSDIAHINKVINQFNKQLNNDMFVSLNELYSDLGLEAIEIGDNLGWHIEDGLLDIRFTAKITPDERPCIVINYNITPKEYNS